jgi:hypothetical protein
MDDHRTIELLLANIVSSVNDAIVSLDEDLRIVFLNGWRKTSLDALAALSAKASMVQKLSDVIAQCLTEPPPAGQIKPCDTRRTPWWRRIFHMEAAVAGARVNGSALFHGDYSGRVAGRMERALYSVSDPGRGLVARGIAHVLTISGRYSGSP